VGHDRNSTVEQIARSSIRPLQSVPSVLDLDH
jgi:hypothetical protein